MKYRSELMGPFVIRDNDSADHIGASRGDSKKKRLCKWAHPLCRIVMMSPSLTDIFFSFQPQKAFFLEGLHGAVFHEIVVMAHFRSNEMIRKIGVNHAGGILCIGSARDCPGAAFFFADGKEGNQSQQPICRPYQAFGAGLRQTVVGIENVFSSSGGNSAISASSFPQMSVCSVFGRSVA